MNTVRCYLGLGANLGDSNTLFDQVLFELNANPLVHHLCESPRYRSAPVDADGPDYLNSVLQLDWESSAQALLDLCLHTEQQHGRTRLYRNAPRPLDLDVLLFGDQTIHTHTLQVPHPRMHERRFVLEPLLALAPSLLIPNQGAVAALLPATLHQPVFKT